MTTWVGLERPRKAIVVNAQPDGTLNDHVPVVVK